MDGHTSQILETIAQELKNINNTLYELGIALNGNLIEIKGKLNNDIHRD